MNPQKFLSVVCFAMLVVQFSYGQNKNKWNVSNPEGPFKNVEFDVNEGTWMNLDVSPDGKEIVFDLLGDIYSMPMAGGKATFAKHGCLSACHRHRINITE